jgi:hypothetical protein
MRGALALLASVLVIAWSPLHGQAEKEARDTKKPTRGHAVGKDSQQPKTKPSPAAQQQRKTEEERRRTQGRQANDPSRPQDQRARERVPGDPPPKHGAHSVSRDSQPPKGPPSKAQQMQQEQYEQRRAQQGDPLPADAAQVVQCRARPVCGGGYGICQGVMQTYTGSSVNSGRHAIVQQCVQANTPDSCNCAAQCERVAHCSIF